MKKFLFSTLLLVIVACSFSFTDPVAKCYNTYSASGDDNGDACIDAKCKFKEKVNFQGAQWVDCGGSQ